MASSLLSQKYITSSEFSNPAPLEKEHISHLGAPFIESFNFMVEEGLSKAMKKIIPIVFTVPENYSVCLWAEVFYLLRHLPSLACWGLHLEINTLDMFGFEPRSPAMGAKFITESLTCPQYPMYSVYAQLSYDFVEETCTPTSRSYDPGEESPYDLPDVELQPPTLSEDADDVGKFKIYPQRVKMGEEENEIGGYFVVKGHERLIRMLVNVRRNYPLALSRSSWKQRGKLFSDQGVLIRCVRDDESSTNNVLHYLRDGTAKIMFSFSKQMYFAPLMMVMKALVDVSDKFIYEELISGMEDNLYYLSCVKNMLRVLQEEKLYTQLDMKRFIGQCFHDKVVLHVPESKPDEDVADFLIDECVLVHLNTRQDKFRLLVLMTKKLFSYVSNGCSPESPDSPMMWEVCLAGHVILQALKDQVENFLVFVRNQLIHRSRNQDLFHLDHGLTIVLENINWLRYISHFRALHRGSFFLQMRTSEVRKLLPEAWGFICPIHTPDGTPCGLLNHLTWNCEIITSQADTSKYPELLCAIGMIPLDSMAYPRGSLHVLPVLLDGRLIGHVHVIRARDFIWQLRMLKIAGEKVSRFLEIGYVPNLGKPEAGSRGGQWPGIFLFAGPSRLMRPIFNIYARSVEMIGVLEQVYLHIAVTSDEVREDMTTHMELSAISMMSNLACLIPLPDHNQSPRNMFQCQMSKQTMGTAFHCMRHRPETKQYRLITPTSPLFRPAQYDRIQLDDYPVGTNAIVAVISYTGYDMEDAMVISKASMERGLAHACIYKSEVIDLKDLTGERKTALASFFGRDPEEKKKSQLEDDGFPPIGARLNEGDAFYSYYDAGTGRYRTMRYKSTETAHVDTVRFCPAGEGLGEDYPRVCITLRMHRPPSVGDKFASRAGQKGICSMLYKTEDLPWTENGLTPDIIFNPHGLPSRMTMAKVMECMAGKAAAMHGHVYDAQPFRFNEKQTAADYYGKLLEMAGFNYYGTETMYCGTSGEAMPADIFFGVIHYQRLRHMVLDKWQVRSTGAVNAVTHQPVGGRKRGGGVRLGEMERDGLISHGASFLLQDRLFEGSDKSLEFFCFECGSLLTVCNPIPKGSTLQEDFPKCLKCDTTDTVTVLEIPYVFKLLCSQLAAANVKVTLSTKRK
ncbi:unnamed protein product [Darwinula stevensoni]|uniref:DNA-directed RNA polymerase subunit beta n=1 Tax=Darwinula stevensoni TaxID=69355 RepID=A0A7R8X8P2_9CRUS|nr:unnamed protein product [Darwinula stevensoni]CAG0884695.1 unnamed protein product [Darwinula stevensoni]